MYEKYFKAQVAASNPYCRTISKAKWSATNLNSNEKKSGFSLTGFCYASQEISVFPNP